MNETIDKLIFALDGDLSRLKMAFAEADTQASVTGKKIGDSIGKPIKEASEKAGASISVGLDKGFKEAAASAAAHATKIKHELDKVAPAVVAGQTAIQKSVKLTSGEISNLSFQINDVISGLAMGQRPMQILVQQGGQFAQILQGRGLTGSIQAIGGAISAMISPAVAAGLAVGGIGIAAGMAAYQSEAAAIRIRNALAANGFASGATSDDVLRASRGLVDQGRYSMRGAQDVVGIAASRGNIPSGLFGAFGAASTGLSRAIPGSSQQEAAQKLEEMLADPAAAAKELNEQFKLLDVAATRQVTDLMSTGRVYDAQKLILDAVNNRFKTLEDGAWSLSKTFGAISRGFSNFWNNTGNLLTGNGQTKQEQIQALQLQNAMTMKALAAQGISDPRKTLADFPSTGLNVGGGIKPLRNIMAEVDANAAKIKVLADQLGSEHYQARIAQERNQANDAIGAGLADAAKGAGAFNEQLKQMQQTLDRDQLAVRKATETGSQYTKVLTEQRDAQAKALEAVKKYGSPEAQAAQRAMDVERIANAPISSRGRVQAEVQAEERRRQNLMNPATALRADAIYQSELRAARFNTRDDGRNDQRAEQQRKNLAGMQAEAVAAEKVAAAYDQGAAAVEAARIAGEAHAAVIREEIANEKAYADALQRRAFATASASVAQKRLDDEQTIAGLRRVAAAGGNPASIQSATEQNNAIAATAKLFAAAQNDAQKAKAVAEYAKALSDEQAKSAANRLIAANKETQALEQNLELMKLQERLMYADAELRAREIADLQTIQQLANAGYQRGTAEYDAEFARRQALNRAQAALGAKGEGSEGQFYSTFRNGLGDVLSAGVHGFKSLGDAAQSFLSQLGQLAVQLYIIKPLLNMALGVSGSSGGGFLGSLFSSVFGGGLATGGPVDPSKFYMVGENGPELLGPGVAGHITPLSAPNTVGGGMGTTLNTNFNATIIVQGTGDKQLMENMRAGAMEVAGAMIEENNKALARGQRPKLLASNKRALLS